MSKPNPDSINLDLSDIPSDDVDQLASRIELFYKNDSTLKNQLAYNWERNQLMLDGKQWIVRNNSNQAQNSLWNELTVSRANEYIPRPVTNYLFDAYQTLKAYLIQHRPRSTVFPNTQNYEDKMRAKLAELIAECNWEKLREEMNYEYAAACVCLYGTVFKKDYWDTSSVMMAKVPRMEEQPMTDPQTGAVVGYEEKPVIDPATGDAIMDEIPLGDVNTEVIEPYRIALDPLAQDLSNPRWVIEYSIQPLSWIREMYSKEEPGYTGLADQVKEEQELSNSLRRFYELKTSSGVKGFVGYPGMTSSSSGSNTMVPNCAVVKEYYERPSQTYPKGRLIVVANGKTLYADESPYAGPELGDWHPYSEARWEIVPGRFWGKSFFDDAVELQKRLNSIDATIVLTRKTMAIPQKLNPKGSGIKKGEWTGRPGQVIEYRADASGAKPEVIPPIGVDAQVWQERSQIVEDLKAITGAIDILKGDRPPGVTAASALEMLFEVGTGKLRPVLERWKMLIESSQKKQLKLVAKKYQEPREDYIRMLQAKNKDLPADMIDDFIGMDLHDNCNLRVEAGSNIPKLESARKANLMEIANTGALQLEDPENRAQFLEDMGVVGYDQSVSPDIKRAEYENDLLDNIMKTPEKKPVVLDIDDHEVHIKIHERRMKQPSFMSLDFAVQQAYMQHDEEHKMKIEEAEQQQMQKAIMSGQPPQPQQPSPATQPTPLKPSGKGVPSSVKETIMAADLPKRA